MKVIPSKDDRTTAADDLNADLDRIYSWGQTWNINFELAKCRTLCVSLKRDIDLHPPLFMATLPIDEVNTLKILGIHFDRKLLGSHMIDQLVTRCRQRLGALYHVRDYLGQSGIVTAFRSFVRPVCEYGSVIFMGASVTHLRRLDLVQWRGCVRLHFRYCHLARKPVLLLCKLLDGQCREPLQNFCPVLISVTHTYHLRHVIDDPLSLLVLTQFNSLDLFIRSFLGAIPLIWASLSLTLRQRGAAEGWTAVCHLLQKHLIV